MGAALLFPAIGSAPFERAEIYFMDGARSMVERGDYLVPYYRGRPFFDKPALTYWLMAGSFRIFGFTPEAARLVSALATLGAVLATVWLGTLLLDRRAALVGGWVLVTTLAFVGFGRVAMSDTLLTLWSTLAFGLAVAAFGSAPRPWLVPAIGGVLGLGFQTKGPIAVLLPGLGILILLWRHRRVRLPVTAFGAVTAAVLFALAGLGWFVALYHRLGSRPLVYFFLQENIQRFAGETYDSGREPWYYLATYLAEGLPWSVFLPVALAGLLRKAQPAAAGLRLLVTWLGLMAVPLSLSRGKIDYYLLPFYPAASLVIGHYVSTVEWGRLERGWARAALLLLATGLVLVAAAPAPLPHEWLPGPGARMGLCLAALAGIVGLLTAALRPLPLRILAALGITAAALFLILASAFLPAFRAGQPNRAILEDVARELGYRPDARLALCEDPARVQRDLLFHARISVMERCDLWAPASSRLPFLLLLSPEEIPSLASLPSMRVVSEHRYVPASSLGLRGLWHPAEPDTLTLVANYKTSDPVAELKRKKERKRALRALGEWPEPTRRSRARP